MAVSEGGTEAGWVSRTKGEVPTALAGVGEAPPRRVHSWGCWESVDPPVPRRRRHLSLARDPAARPGRPPLRLIGGHREPGAQSILRHESKALGARERIHNRCYVPVPAPGAPRPVLARRSEMPVPIRR